MSKKDTKDYYTNILKAGRHNPAGFVTALTNLFVDSDGTPQVPYSKQIEYMNMVPDYAKIVTIVKPRQSGFSTAACAKIIHSSYFKEYPEYLIMSTGKGASEKILSRIRKAFLSMPEELFPGFATERNNLLELSTGPKIYSLTSNPTTAVGFTGPSVLDEAATFSANELQEIYRALFPATTKGGNITLISTPRGKNNLFYSIATDNMENSAELRKHPELARIYYRIALNVHDVPHQKIQEHILRAGCPIETMWRQEYMGEFLDASDEYIFDRSFIIEQSMKESEELKIKEFDTSSIYFGEKFLYKNSLENMPELSGENIEIHNRYGEFYAGWDGACGGEDYSILTIFGVPKEQRIEHEVHKVLCRIWQKVDFDTQIEELVGICNWIGIKRLLIDGTGAAGNIFQRQIEKSKPEFSSEKFVFTKQGRSDGTLISKSELYMQLKLALSRRQIIQLEDEMILEHYGNVMYDSSRDYFYHNKKKHEDHVTSQALAWHAYVKNRGVSKFSFLAPKSENGLIIRPNQSAIDRFSNRKPWQQSRIKR